MGTSQVVAMSWNRVRSDNKNDTMPVRPASAGVTRVDRSAARELNVQPWQQHQQHRAAPQSPPQQEVHMTVAHILGVQSSSSTGSLTKEAPLRPSSAPQHRVVHSAAVTMPGAAMVDGSTCAIAPRWKSSQPQLSNSQSTPALAPNNTPTASRVAPDRPASACALTRGGDPAARDADDASHAAAPDRNDEPYIQPAGRLIRQPVAQAARGGEIADRGAQEGEFEAQERDDWMEERVRRQAGGE